MKMIARSTQSTANSILPETESFLRAETNVPVTAFQLRPDLAICFWECSTRIPQSYTISFNQPVLRFSFVLEGEGFSSICGERELPRHRGLVEVRAFHTLYGTYELAAGQQHKWVDIILKPSFLSIALPLETDTLPLPVQSAINGDYNASSPTTRKMTPEQFIAAKQLAHCPYTNAARTLFLKSKALELLSHVMAEQSPVPCKTQLSSYEAECLKRARETLIADLENPPSLPSLAQTVGLSETKLKTGFKALFGQTVYGYLRAFRVDRGKQKLLESTDSISDIATSVGYTNISHFSAAFKDRHGVTPSRYRKQNILFSTTSDPA